MTSMFMSSSSGSPKEDFHKEDINTGNTYSRIIHEYALKKIHMLQFSFYAKCLYGYHNQKQLIFVL